MAEDTQILIISGTKDNLNYLTLGPIFKKLRSLEEIHIKWSSIPNIGAHSFWGLGDVKVLNLTHNSLSTLMDSNFKGLSSLKQLDLSHNSIESVPSAVFRFIRHLHFLNLSHNKMFSLVTRIFFGLTRLENLDLSHNPLGDLQAELFSDVPALKKLSCAACELRNLSEGIFGKLTEVKDLDLRNNFLTKVPERLSTLAELVTIKLDGNLISSIDDYTFCDSPISFLFLSHNKIVSVEPKAFVNSSITYLDLSYNKLATLESEGFNIILPHLREFKVNGNPLLGPQLNLLFDRTKQLVHLGLGDVGLMKVPEIGKVRNLHSLNFSSNFISNIPINLFVSTPHLHELDLSFNQLEEIDENVLVKVSASKSLRMFKLEGNPWKCDQCHIVPLIQWLQESPDQESGCSEPQVWTCVKCATPQVVSHQPLALLPVGDLPQCEHPVTPVPAVLDDSSLRRYSFDNHFVVNGSSVDYIDKLNELKIAPSLTDKSMFPVNKLTKNQIDPESEVPKQGLSFIILISVLSIFIVAIIVFMLVFTIRR
ncbi:Leucine-rich repeat, partial [Trinorchestia longiramus]